jgi:hypothetical protein
MIIEVSCIIKEDHVNIEERHIVLVENDILICVLITSSSINHWYDFRSLLLLVRLAAVRVDRRR